MAACFGKDAAAGGALLLCASSARAVSYAAGSIVLYYDVTKRYDCNVDSSQERKQRVTMWEEKISLIETISPKLKCME